MHKHKGFLIPGGVFEVGEMYFHDLGGETVGEVFEDYLEVDPVGKSVIIDPLDIGY